MLVNLWAKESTNASLSEGSMLHSFSVVPNTLWPYGLLPPRLLCPSNYPGKNLGMGCCALLWGCFQTLLLNPQLLCLLHRQVCSLPLAAPGKPTSACNRPLFHLIKDLRFANASYERKRALTLCKPGKKQCCSRKDCKSWSSVTVL